MLSGFGNKVAFRDTLGEALASVLGTQVVTAPGTGSGDGTGTDGGPSASPTPTPSGTLTAEQRLAAAIASAQAAYEEGRVALARGDFAAYGVAQKKLEVALAADGIEIARRNLGVHPPLAWAPDGAFLTIGYARPFPVSDEYSPPASAPLSLIDISIQVGRLPPLDVDAELARVLRHQ